MGETARHRSHDDKPSAGLEAAIHCAAQPKAAQADGYIEMESRRHRSEIIVSGNGAYAGV